MPFDQKNCSVRPVRAGSAAHRLVQVHIVVVEEASRAAIQMIHELFAVANEFLPDCQYRVRPEIPAGADGVAFHPQAQDLVIFLGGIRQRWRADRADRILRQKALRHAGQVIFAGGAVFLLDEDGLREKYRLAVHPNFSVAARELAMDFTGSPVFEATDKLGSAISGFALIQLLLATIRRRHGPFLGKAIGRYLGLEGEDLQDGLSRIGTDLKREAAGDPVISATLDLMLDNIEEPLQIRDLARQVDMTRRSLERRFQSRLASTPSTVYRKLRLEQARQLVEQTDMSMADVGLATGFASPATLTASFKQEFRARPIEIRQQAYSGRV